MASDTRMPGGGYLFIGAAVLMPVRIPVSFYFSKQSPSF